MHCQFLHELRIRGILETVMKKLLEFLVEGILGNDKFTISESQETGQTHFVISVPKEFVGLIIGKEGKTIKTIRNLLRVKATLEKVGVGVSVEEKS